IRTLFRRPRLRPLPGMGGVPAAPLAVAATALSVVLLSVATVLLVTTVATSLAAIVDPARALTLAPARFGLVALFAGLIGWRISTHWGRPPAHALIRLALGAVAAGAALVLIFTRAAGAVGVVPDGPAFRAATATLFATAVAVGTGALLGLGAVLGRRGFEIVRTGRWTTALTWVRGHAEAIAVIGALLLLAVPILRFISLGQVLGFDEAVYAATARAWVLDTPNTAWVSHRSPGISALAVHMAAAEWDAGVRLVGFGFSMGAVAAGWALGRRLAGAAAGVLAALLTTAIPSLQLNGALFLTDVPSATGILVLMLVLWRQVEERARPSAALLWLAPLAAAVFYIRYGASVPILFLAVTTFLLWGRRLLDAWRVTLATAALLGLLLVPHLVQSTLLHGNPLAIALSAQTGASPAYPGEALREYLRMVPSEIAGPVGGLLLALGVVAWPIRVLLRGLGDRSVRAHTFLVVPAVGQFVLLGLVALPQARYVLLPVMLLLLAGALTAVDAGRWLSRAWRTTLAAGLAAAVVVGAVGTAAVMIRLQAEVTPASSHLIDAARLIRGDADGRPCSILGYPTPQLIWYSGCAAQHFGYPPVAGRASTLSGERRYLLLSTTVTDREPAGALRDEYLQLVEPQPVAIARNRVTGEPALEVYLLTVPD
ncbi:MAG: glycosyltransferase family 39 protein, partial [Chloroflexi bacterium]|nr:glycosyltransferase family 39 protein [Chloroflexota bacterium]